MKNISILDNLSPFSLFIKKKEDKKRAIELLEQGLGHKINSKPNDLSQESNKERHCFGGS